jgi:hypothetical protein
LVGCRRGDGVAIVAADEYAGDLAGGCDVERAVEVSFGGGTFAEIADCDARRLFWILDVLHLESVRGARGVGDLSSEGGTDGVDVELLAAVVNGHVASQAIILGVGEELVHEIGQLEASL